ncbi:hypothetical protein C3432_20325 [Citrobacter amalonaticus]|uniref:DNA utilization protein HofO C-terminal domain-containing protein n=1 Tax=Citrobacter amalonaticus TaxID=35703 RepID=A0A2S4RUM3_CITAM|nr:hypothetical protein [Citrobacter amalonaticus]POT55411.1 hypothetical protein C3432_20325 [Citrobacter amalonaticus]POT73622.1 hypothetical protein C3436_17790 [Citrobacter amalonaticus]POU63846.1 hypothetical protein C3430_16725 [Citrobacter amalonaticus]POV03480.1 hypothetical protein C3424_19640 [Citrobacter amalonaticus]
MNSLVDAWCALPTRLRIGGWCLWSLSLCVLAAICMPDMAQPESEERLQQRVALRGQWQALRHLVNSVDEHLMATDGARPSFSPLHFQVPQMRLQHWKPTASGGEMALKGQWDAVPQIFSQLALQGMGVSQFSFRVEDAELLLTFQLEQPNDG